MAWVPAAAAIASAAASAAGAMSQASAASRQADYQAQVARVNQQIAEQNAQRAIQVGEQKATTQGLQGAAVGGRIKSALAANNVDVNSGSALDVEKGQAEASQLDTETTRYNALLDAYGYRTQGAGYAAQAGLEQAQSANASTAGLFSAGGSLLSGAKSIPLSWVGGGSSSGG